MIHEGHVSPIERFREAIERAKQAEPEYPDAAVLATVDATGRPSARVVLVRGYDERGFTFYTNHRSRKGQELDGQKVAALCIHWKTLREQIRIEGSVARVSEAESDAYFAGRPRESQLGAHASLQSELLSGREELERRLEQARADFDGAPVPRPTHWGGYRLTPDRVEFWNEGAFRLHDRSRYELQPESGTWLEQRLFP